MVNPKAQERPNLFDMLQLDPEAPFTTTSVAALLDKRQGELTSKSQGSGSAASWARVVLGFFHELRSIANDPDRLAAEAKAAVNLRQNERDAKRARFDAELEFASRRGNIYKSEVVYWVQEYADVLSETEIESAIKAQKAPVQDDSLSNSEQYLDSLTWKPIQEDLDLLGFESLYELLKVTEAADLTTLVEQANDIRRAVNKSMNKTEFVSAKGRLAGHSMTVFGQEQKRRQYDASLRRERVRRAAKALEPACSADNMLHGAQVDLLVEKVTSKYGMAKQAALYELESLAREKKWVILSSQTGSSAGQPDDPRVKELENQIRSLQAQNIQVAILKGELSKQDGDKRKLREELERAEVERRKIEAALARARSDLEAAEAIHQRQVAKEQERRIKGIEKRQQTIESLMTARKYCQAQRELEAMSQRPAEWAELARVIARHIESAERKFEAAKRESNIVRAEQLAQDALDEVADFDPAKKWLRELTPAPPRNLKVVVDNGIARLTWETSGSSNVRYVVVRSTDERATSIIDGSRVGETTALEMTDGDIPPGNYVFYSVFARRDNLTSRTAATTDTPVITLPEVTHLRKEVDDSTVILSWTPPQGVMRVTVTRWQGTQPGGDESGIGLPAPSNSSVRDGGLTNGRSYSYLVRCVYDQAGGAQILSRGVHITATPSAPPTVVPTLRVHVERLTLGFGQRVGFEAHGLHRGDLKVLKCSGRVPTAGERLPEEELSRLGRLFALSESDTVLSSSVNTYAPVVVAEGSALVGEAVRHVWVEDVRNLSTEVHGERIRLEWGWPTLVDAAEIRSSQEGNTGATSLLAHVARNLGERTGSYELLIGHTHPPNLLVIASAVLEGHRELAQGVSAVYPSARSRESYTVTYGFRCTRRPLGGKNRKLALQVEGAHALPPLVIRIKHGEPPKDKADGTLLMVLRNIEVTTPDHEVSLTTSGIDPDMYGAVFIEDELLASQVVLRPISQADQRIE